MIDLELDLSISRVIRGGWRPNATSFFSAVIELTEHPEGTLYSATATHKDKEACEVRAEMGFVEGWGLAIKQLDRLVTYSSSSATVV